ncbi:MAG: hypothetical protein K9J83_08455 [Desulfarculaceae bacterium]|nr:hypothetical protein [Desulfarculaceae bacterium]
MKKRFIAALAFLLLCLFAAAGCRTGSPVAAKPDKPLVSGTVHTKYNIHIQHKGDKALASYANWVGPFPGHDVIEPDTKVVASRWRSGFRLDCVEKGLTVLFEFDPARMNMSASEYVKKITSGEPVSYDHLSGVDQKGIRNGEAYRGMSKKGVMAALGYPAAHRTPSPDSDTWTYWTNRFNTIAVHFDDSGKVREVID